MEAGTDDGSQPVRVLVTAASDRLDAEAATQSLPEIASYLQNTLGQRTAAAIAGLGDAKQIGRYARTDGPSPQTTTERRLREGYKVVRMLVDAYDDKTARAWLLGTNTRLDDRTPIEVLGKAKDTTEFVSVVQAARQASGTSSPKGSGEAVPKPKRTTMQGSWNTIYGTKTPHELAAALFELAADCSRKAIDEPPADQSGFDRWVRLTAIGQAAEMLLKATLANINPVLIADNTGMATLCALSGNGQQPSGKVATASGVEAFKRLIACMPAGMKGIPEPKAVFEVRHGAQHLALANDEDLETALTELVTLVDWVFKVRAALNQQADLSAFWSPRHFAIVEARRKARYEDLREYFGGVVGEAKAVFIRLTAGLSDNERNRVIGELEARQPPVEDEQTARKHNCPACGSYMWVVYDVHREIDIDESEMPHGVSFYANVSGTANYAECPVCDLFLDAEYLVLTDIELQLDLGIDQATDDEEEGWRDARHAEHATEWEYADLGPDDDMGDETGTEGGPGA